MRITKSARRILATSTVAGSLLAAVTGGVLGGAGTAAAAGPALTPGTPCTVTAKACVDLSQNRAWLIQDGQVYYGEASALGGKPDQPTPTGTFQVQWKDQDHRSGEANGAPMPFAVFFAPGGVAFHQGSLSKPSAGCVHLSAKSAKTFFDHLNPGDEVQVVG